MRISGDKNAGITPGLECQQTHSSQCCRVLVEHPFPGGKEHIVECFNYQSLLFMPPLSMSDAHFVLTILTFLLHSFSVLRCMRC